VYYVVKDGEVIIVDEFTGRLMPGRRYSHGLHQAIEAKEGVEVQRESKTLATITFQNYFRLYGKLAGMTGTAKTEEEEFESIYKLRTVVVPTHRPMVRVDNPDSIYRTVPAKFVAVAKLAKEKNATGQPVLIGTTSIEKSEAMSALLQERGIAHSVLNAKQHEKEAEIVALAGQKGTVTIATNMAGRGTDIKLGEGVADLGGLCIIGTERHESRRIDNQLRGRSGRQGDRGESHFFVSMEDDLMRLFGGDRLKTMMERLQVPDDQPLQNGIVSRSIQSAQKRVEGHHFDVRKHVLQYDDVMNRHRDIIYKRRRALLEKLAQTEAAAPDGGAGGLRDDIVKALRKEADAIVALHAPTADTDLWQAEQMSDAFGALNPELKKELAPDAIRAARDQDTLKDVAEAAVLKTYEAKCAAQPAEAVARAERVIVLRSIDTHWMDHIDAMAHLREQVAFSGYAQRDPLIEYQDRAFRMFQELLQTIDATIVRTLMGIDFAQFAPQRVIQQAEEELSGLQTNENQIEGELTATGVQASLEGSAVLQGAQKRHAPARQPIESAKVGRNDPCPCGSGKKYKKCHGANE
jgi:preprotein translocase subunit SecA